MTPLTGHAHGCRVSAPVSHWSRCAGFSGFRIQVALTLSLNLLQYFTFCVSCTLHEGKLFSV